MTDDDVERARLLAEIAEVLRRCDVVELERVRAFIAAAADTGGQRQRAPWS